MNTTTSRLDFVRAYLERGWIPVPIPSREKCPIGNAWQKLRPTVEDLPKLFAGLGNVGLLLGEPSAGLVDVDLDCAEARALADTFLPPTPLEHGRASSPRSHRWYLVSPAPGKITRYQVPAPPVPDAPKSRKQVTLVELRSTGGQTVVPPSIHPSGELLEWTACNDGAAADGDEPDLPELPDLPDPASVSAEDLSDAVATLAAACMLARAWPGPGGRHDASLALAGALLRSGWTQQRTATFIAAVARTAGDDEVQDRVRGVKSTAEAISSGARATGIPSLVGLVGAEVTKRLTSWLGLGTGDSLMSARPVQATPPRQTPAAPPPRPAAPRRPQPPEDETPAERRPHSLATALRALSDASPDEVADVLRDTVRALAPRILAGQIAPTMARSAILAAAAALPAAEAEAIYDEVLDEVRLEPPAPPPLDRKAPARTARALIAHAYALRDAADPAGAPADTGLRLLHHYRGEFHRWRDGAYQSTEESALRSQAWGFLEAGGVTPNSSRVSNVLDALRGASYLDGRLESPCWLTGSHPHGGDHHASRPTSHAHHPDHAVPLDPDHPPPTELVALRNGLLHAPTERLLPATPLYFTLCALPFDYAPGAPPPTEWLSFLADLWPEDQESIDCLQEVFGYLLTPDTSLQKMFLLLGPTRSGKGTISRVLRSLLGDANTASPTLASLAQNFGLAPLIGKTAALVSDARLSGKLDQQVIVERLLSISGEDAIDIDRKYLTTWTGQLRARFVILTNELPRLGDSSSALPKRFVPLKLTKTFYGEEDPTLFERRLRPELSSILHWALAGRRRLYERGHFLVPSSAYDLVTEMEELASPVAAFVAERCLLGANETIACPRLFQLWEEWCKANARDYPGTVQSFARDIRAVVPELRVVRPGTGGARGRSFVGIGEKMTHGWGG